MHGESQVLTKRETHALTPQPADYAPDHALIRLAPRGPQATTVIGQLGQSLDGRIATPTGASKYINGTEALRHLHRLRAECDAVIVGVGTAIADNPRLTTRLVPGRNPARVVIDPNGRMPSELAMLGDGAGRVLAIERHGATGPANVERLALDSCANGHIDPGAIVEALAMRGLRRILVEGGAETLARFINAGALDELHLMIAPIILGSGKTGLNLSPIEMLDEAMRPSVQTMRFSDGDLLCVCDLAAAEAACESTPQTASRAAL
ncbi:MAG: RibD family protein [Pseudomonadota bacterium]